MWALFFKTNIKSPPSRSDKPSISCPQKPPRSYARCRAAWAGSLSRGRGGGCPKAAQDHISSSKVTQRVWPVSPCYQHPALFLPCKCVWINVWSLKPQIFPTWTVSKNQVSSIYTDEIDFFLRPQIQRFNECCFHSVMFPLSQLNSMLIITRCYLSSRMVRSKDLEHCQLDSSPGSTDTTFCETLDKFLTGRTLLCSSVKWG